MKLRVFISLVALMAILLSSCLTAQYKEYKFEFDGKTSGTLTITHSRRGDGRRLSRNHGRLY